MLLSDRDIKAEIESGRVKLDPHDPELIQPSSIDVRLDRGPGYVNVCRFTPPRTCLRVLSVAID